jgi:hypothetical protein
MNIPPSELKAMTWWEYQGLLWHWNERHTPPEDEAVEAPDADFVMKRQAKLERMGIVRSIH